MPHVSREDLEKVLQSKVIATGVDPHALFPTLHSLFDALPDPGRALNNLVRYLDAAISSTLLRDAAASPVQFSVFLDLVSQSQYLADILVRHPEWLHWLLSTGELKRIKSVDQLRNEAQAVQSPFEHHGRRRDALARFHRREILRIGAMDILGEGSLADITGQLSALADVVIDEAVTAAYRSIVPASRPRSKKELAVIGLGKLGGSELNFSSDIDLMFVYDTDAELKQPVGRIRSSQELHVRLAEFVVSFLTEVSGEAYFYRVDMRLRPDGRSGPLALSRASYMTYYESRGAQWERQMLIKARVVGGNRAVGDALLDGVRPFVYRRTILSSPWRDIASMKRSIEEEFRSESNIELGAGGIRDIEFLVQGLQLMHGGQIAEVRSPNTLRALDALGERGLLPTQEARDLRTAYELFRDIEHRLQLLYGFQTHEMPESSEEFGILARKLGHAAGDFRALVAGHRSAVRKYFTSATGEGGEQEGAGMSAAERGALEPLLRGNDQVLAADVAASVRGTSIPATTLSRFAVLLAQDGIRPAVTQALRSERLRRDLVTSIGSSSVLFERLAAEPLLVESLVGQAAALLTGAEPGWTELSGGDPARFKRYNEVRSSIRFLSGQTGLRGFETELTHIAERVVNMNCTAAEIPEDMLVVGAGKLGSGEMGISSDLDLVLFYDEQAIDQETAQRTGKRFVGRFATPSKSYDVDLRLRPEGRNAPLVAGISYLQDYLNTRADVWEVLALKRSRVLWGREPLRVHYVSLLRSFRHRDNGTLVASVRTMRERMEKERRSDEGIDLKIGRGGIVDIEFLAQLGSILVDNAGGTPTSDMLGRLLADGLLRQREEHVLREALQYLRSLETIVRLNSQVSGSTMRDGTEAVQCAAAFVGASSVSTLIETTRQRMSAVRRIYESVLERWEAG